jgi:UDP-N-acetylglucosamine 2-epimerase (non-hydrolysing)
VKHKVMVVFGTRPEAIKLMPVVQTLRSQAGLEAVVVSTGQHREMLAQVLATFEEAVDIDLDIMSTGQSLERLTSNILESMSRVIAEVRPTIVVVHGDTTTAMASGLAAFYARVPVAHVEAGLRSHDINRPWPEEFNRVAIDAIADLLFAPTEEAAQNLYRESSANRKILITGNTGIDALLHVADRVGAGLPGTVVLPNSLGQELVLVTGHRRESFGGGFMRICEGLRLIASRPNVQIVYPVHLNPRVRNVVLRELSDFPNIHLIEPLPYSEMVALMGAAKVILTDSGGIQEEGPALGKPVVVMRDVTERPEGVASGVVSLVGTDPRRISGEVLALLDDEQLYSSRARRVFPYGDGRSAARIVSALVDFCEARARQALDQ